MRIIDILGRRSLRFYIQVIVLSLLSSALYSGILILINKTVSGGYDGFIASHTDVLFLCLVVASYFSSRSLQAKMIRSSQDMTFDLEISLLKKLRHSQYQQFCNLGQEKIYTAFSDTRVLASTPQVFMDILNSSVIILCGLAYTFYITPLGGLLIFCLMNLLLITYLVRDKGIEKDLQRVRSLQNDQFRYLRDFIFGYRELKMSIERDYNIFFKFLRRNKEQHYSLSLGTSMKYMNNELAGDLSWYLVLGIIVFFLPRLLAIELTELVAVVVSILFLMKPVSALIRALPSLTRMKVAITRINDLNNSLGTEASHREIDRKKVVNKNFESLRLEDITYCYPGTKADERFALGPLSLTIGKGEIVFITGGNGSGKTTFVNLTTGLLKPSGGAIYLNNVKVDEENMPYYRDCISAIFSDPYLPSENYNNFDFKADEPGLEEFVRRLKLENVFRTNGNNWVNVNLSKGQQKRVCMIAALMENREILVLDEWAAEQDPGFRRYFYETMLPAFKSEGKTVIAVTHDDAFFHCADRVLKLDYGKISEKANVMMFKSPF